MSRQRCAHRWSEWLLTYGSRPVPWAQWVSWCRVEGCRALRRSREQVPA